VKPVWIALPCVAVLAGASLWFLSHCREPVQTRIPGKPQQAPPAPALSPGALELTPAEFKALQKARNQLPDRLPPQRPPRDSEFQQPGAKADLFIYREKYANGDCRAEYQVRKHPIKDEFSATVVDFSRRMRDNTGLSYLLASHTRGAVPNVGTEFEVIDQYGDNVGTCKLIRLYHVDDNEDLPIEELGFSSMDARLWRYGRKGLKVVLAGIQPVRHGFWRAWYQNGEAAAEGQYNEGKRDGDWFFWHPDGSVRAVGEFKNDRPAGTWNMWYSNGAHYAVWHEADKDNQFGGWQVNEPDGSLKPCFDPAVVGPLHAMATAIDKREYRKAMKLLKDSEALLNSRDESESRRALLNCIGPVLEKLTLIVNSKDEEEQEGQRRLLKFIELRDLFWVIQSHKPPLPPYVFPRR
jgi:hypothetical protein